MSWEKWVDRCRVLTKLGWTSVELSMFKNRQHAVDVYTWAHENCREDFNHHGTFYIFKSQADAVLFTLRWV